jgi:hypothetical protein
MKSLTLLIDDKEKTFTAPFVTGMVWRKWIELQDKVADLSKLTVKEMDEFANLVVIAFNQQFTLEQFYSGLPFDEIMWTIESLFIPEGKSEGNEKK